MIGMRVTRPDTLSTGRCRLSSGSIRVVPVLPVVGLTEPSVFLSPRPSLFSSSRSPACVLYAMRASEDAGRRVGDDGQTPVDTVGTDSRRGSSKEQVPAQWTHAIELLQSGDSFTTTITNVNKSGVLVKVGSLSGFIPYKLMNQKVLMSIPKDTWTDVLVGRDITVKVTQVVVPERRLICSEKAVMLERAAGLLKVGDVVEGEISSLHNFGAFVEISSPEMYAGTEVILPLRELSWDWVANVGAVVTKGQVVKTKVVDLSAGPQCKVVVSLKRMEGDPLRETLDSVLPLEADFVVDDKVPIAIPQGVEDILNELAGERGVDEVTLGRRVEERRTVSQDLELWMSKEQMTDGYNLIARAGRVVQEIHVRTTMDVSAMKQTVQRVLGKVA